MGLQLEETIFQIEYCHIVKYSKLMADDILPSKQGFNQSKNVIICSYKIIQHTHTSAQFNN
jgi:hypothetical protein